MLLAAKKDVLPANQRSMVIYEYVCHCVSRYVGRTTQRLQERIKQHVPKAVRQKFIFHGKKQICAGKSSSYSLHNCLGEIKACCHWIDCVSPYYCAISLKSVSPHCRVYFSLLHVVVKRSCSPHTKPDRDRN